MGKAYAETHIRPARLNRSCVEGPRKTRRPRAGHVERPSASDGERRAADWIASELRAPAAATCRVEEEARARRLLVALGCSTPARCWRRHADAGRRARRGRGRAGRSTTTSRAASSVPAPRAPHRATHNVVAEAGDPKRAAARSSPRPPRRSSSGSCSTQALPRAAMERLPQQHAKANQSVPMIYGVFLGRCCWRCGADRPAPAAGARSLFAVGPPRRWPTSARARWCRARTTT